MPLSQHRLALVGILLAIVATFSVRAASAAEEANTPTSNPIAARALRDLGTWQGECWLWMQRVVFDATGRKVGFDYIDGFFEAGAVEVSLKDAQAGDVIQVVSDRYHGPDADYRGLHTLIVLENNGDGTVNGIDANQNWDGMVELRFDYNPAEKALEYGLNFHVYRFGATPGVSTRTSLPPTASKAVRAGDLAVVKAGPEGLNLRPEASTAQAPLGILRDGTQVTVLSDPLAAGGRQWVKISAPAGTGWVAAEFLEKQAATSDGGHTSGSGAGTTAPLRPFRSVITMVSSGS